MTLAWETIARAELHPTKVAILEELERVAEASPVAISSAIEEQLGNVAYHCRALCAAGLIELARTRHRRGALEHFYRLSGAVAS